MSSYCAVVPISPVKLSRPGRFGKWRREKLPFSFFTFQINNNSKKKHLHDPKVNLTYRDEMKALSLFIKALKKNESKRLVYEAVIFYKLIGLNESYFFSVKDWFTPQCPSSLEGMLHIMCCSQRPRLRSDATAYVYGLNQLSYFHRLLVWFIPTKVEKQNSYGSRQKRARR